MANYAAKTRRQRGDKVAMGRPLEGRGSESRIETPATGQRWGALAAMGHAGAPDRGAMRGRRDGDEMGMGQPTGRSRDGMAMGCRRDGDGAPTGRPTERRRPKSRHAQGHHQAPQPQPQVQAESSWTALIASFHHGSAAKCTQVLAGVESPRSLKEKWCSRAGETTTFIKKPLLVQAKPPILA